MPNSSLIEDDFIEVVSPFLKGNPDVGLDITVVDWTAASNKVAFAAAIGEAPDIAQVDTSWVAELSGDGAFVDLSKEINKDKFLPPNIEFNRN
ncbi:extracellular solute-binding protein [Acetivibrio straminisolvens]|jgi:multiple sugar transport system substrate-binding protein|uniref:Uncharacterized protein n=1 Tax=Acetivibrio straminisolvens JCM 21531 TaxID=1294263 RepID=W4V1J3_9FIRM|nr:extracellular solute-binding protein [Acetivibrio straminisolvens]GAE86957.1 hypothetical protein JCM21531_293 [Acetivibrio straminisolvens JCM 21531]